MVIGVLSDTHLKHPTGEFIDLVNGLRRDCDVIVHAGDFVSLDVYKYLNEVKSGYVIAVCGNMDPPELRKILPQKRIFETMGVRIGVTHGWGGPHDLEERIEAFFRYDDVRCIIYGHSHIAVNHKRGETLFFNTGSPTDRYHAKEKSFGYLAVSKNDIIGKIKLIRT